MNKTISQTTKDQAARLRTFLASRNVVLSSTQALEGISHAIYGRPWNVVQAMDSKNNADEFSGRKAKSEVSAVTFFYQTTQGETKTLPMVARRIEDGVLVSEDISLRLHQSSDAELLSLMQTPREDMWLQLAGRRDAHPSEGRGKLVLSGSDYYDSFSIWLAAFRPHLLLDYLAYRLFCGPKSLFPSLFEMGIVQRDSGDWYLHIPYDTRSRQGFNLTGWREVAFDSLEEAEWAFAVVLLGGLDSSNKRRDWLEDLATLHVVKGSGVVEEHFEEKRIPGRHCDKTGAPLVRHLGQGPLSQSELRRITDDCKHYVHIVLQVSMDQLFQGLDIFCDHLSELVTNSVADLEDIGYEAAPVELCLPQPAQNHVWLQVIANWAPPECLTDEDDSDVSEDDAAVA